MVLVLSLMSKVLNVVGALPDVFGARLYCADRRQARSSPATVVLLTALLLLGLGQPSRCEETRGVHVVATNEATGEWQEILLYKKTYAVVIGIGRYPKLPADQQLSYAVSDAKAVERMLRDKFVFAEVHALYNEQAIRQGIMDLLIAKMSRISREDGLFVFFAGHAGQETTEFGDVGFIVPHDGSFDDPANNISMTVIRDDISKRIPAKHIFYVMDCCYSGLLLATRGPDRPKTERSLAYLQQIAKEPVRQILCAGGADEEVLDGGPRGHSVFTGRFLEALDDAQDYVTASEVSVLVRERVFSDAQARNHVQMPNDGEFFGLGDFVFMPSTIKRQQSVAQQIGLLEAEISAFKGAEQKATAAADDAARREAERQRKAAEAKLVAKRLEEERLKEDARLKAAELQRQEREAEAQRKRQEEEEMRLARLKDDVRLKREQMFESMTSSWSGAVKEMAALDAQLRELRQKHLDELKARILSIARAEPDDQVNPEKDEFETQEEYEARLREAMATSRAKDKFQQAEETVGTSYDALAAPLISQMVEISKKKYQLVGDDMVVVELEDYNAERQSFVIRVHYAQTKTPLVEPGEQYYRVTRVDGKAKAAELRVGDILLTYDGKRFRNDNELSALQEQVRGNTVVMQFARNNRLEQVTLKPGTVGARGEGFTPKAGTLSLLLSPDKFMVSGWLKVPRGEARQFKQDYANGFVHGEVTVCVPTPELSLVIECVLIDDATDKVYDLFAGRFVDYGNQMVYDNELRLFWRNRTTIELSKRGAEELIRRENWMGFGNWRLSSGDELKSALHSLGGFYVGYYRTGDSDQRVGVGTPSLFSYSVYFAAVSPFDRAGLSTARDRFAEYGLLEQRFVDIGESMHYDCDSNVIWLALSPAKKSFTDAQRYAVELEHAGITGWRLASVNELKSLYDYTRPGWYTFLNLEKQQYHTRDEKSSSRNQQYSFGTARSYTGSKSDKEYFMCVF